MEVEILALCDAASCHAGKMYIVGTFDALVSPSAPITYPTCSVAARLRFQQIEQGPKTLRIGIVDADGRAVLPTLSAPVQVTVPPNVSSSTVDWTLGIQQLVLPHFGEYRIDLVVDGRLEKSIPLFARQLLASPPLPGFGPENPVGE